MLPTPNRDLPEVVSERIIEMQEVRSELNALNSRIDRLEQTVERGFRELRQSAAHLLDAFSRSMEPLINRMLDHKRGLSRLDNPQA